MKIYWIAIGVILFGSCTAPKQNTNSLDLNIYELAYSSLNIDPVKFNYNKSNDFVLGIYKEDESLGNPTIVKYVVIDVEKKAVVDKGNVKNGRVKWISDYEIQISDPPGVIKESSETSDDYSTILNVKTGNKSSKGAALK
ncbi:MAG: hypothetical protein ACQETL_00565 [Bacteroidota bacterium]